ncbi:MAG: hypothetical protein KZQ72_04950 [Candidatus Thiodiazotropha sp. (ex Cardiolucina cf. quadrata)]|nr:hypothetical protein [Candidatus Thiodiazotropha sp. (ex Cardiolucina cf. quadrata)]
MNSIASYNERTNVPSDPLEIGKTQLIQLFSHHERSYPQQWMAGFSYTEVLIAVFLIAISLVPALNALHSGVLGSDIHATEAVHHHRLISRMEDVLARPFIELEQEADAVAGPTTIIDTYSDASGTDGRCLVYLSRYDSDNVDSDNNPFTDTDDGLLWVKVEIDGTHNAIESLTSQ